MKPQYLSLAKVFGPPVCFVIPLFQRPYIWERKAQWEPLWDDVSTVAERILVAAPGVAVRGHFLGSVVLEQQSTGTGSVDRRSVIDGQQRLTTIQLLLKAATRAFAAVSQATTEDTEALSKAAQQVASLIANPAYATGEEAYKVWPTNEDRVPFRAVMDTVEPLESDNAGHIHGAHAFFVEVIKAWLGTVGAPGARAAALARALMFHLHVIVLDLEATDEPQAIFETLNTGGAPLSPIDLVKNWLLWEAVQSGHNEASCAALHARYWKPFDVDAPYWRQKVGTGHAARPRVDSFLVSWLTERVRIPVTEGHVYETFLDRVAEPARQERGGTADVPALMVSVHTGAERYRSLDQPGLGSGRFGTFLHHLKAMNLVVLHPLLMHLLGRLGSDAADLDACATALESFLVRRLVCSSGTRGYGLLFLNLLGAVAKFGPNGPAAPVINDFLQSGQSGSNTWPEDAAFAHHWATRNAYKGRAATPLMILRSLEEEDWRRDKLAMPVAHFDWSAVQIEHVMPQKWEAHWPLSPGGNVAARNAAVHHIGNLTLVSPGLNPALSNGPWTAKRPELGKHTHLRLTTALTVEERWDEAAIDARSATLFDLALSIWPGPSGAANA